MSEPLIEREEVVALLFNVSDMVGLLEEIADRMPGGDDDAEAEE